MRDVILSLATQDWQKLVNDKSLSTEASTGYDHAISHLSSKLMVPLEAAGVVGLFVDAYRDMSYATQFIALSSCNYQAVWWKLPFFKCV